MKIIDIEVGRISIPLLTPFKTALRTVNSIENLAIKVFTDIGNIGYGEAAPTAVITGDTSASMESAIKDYIKPNIIGLDIENIEKIMKKINDSIVGNTSAKAALDMAIYDLYGQFYNAPLYKLLGGFKKEIETDITISVNSPKEMAEDSIKAIDRGFRTLKIKVGKNPKIDLLRLKAIREAIGYDFEIRLDANQGWRPKEAVSILRQMEDTGLNIELVEQPVIAHDFDGLKFVTDNVNIPVMADESMFSPRDAVKLMEMRAVDLVNIKLMKTGGIYNALKICSLAEIYGIECMMGCMLESKLSVTAAVHLAAAKSVITKIDLDGPSLCKEDPFDGGAIFSNNKIILPDNVGLGFKDIAI